MARHSGRRPRSIVLATIAAVVLVGPLSTALALEAGDPVAGGSPHAAYSSETAHCTKCHVSHEAGSDRYILRFESGDSFSQRAFCYSCHDGNLAANVKTATNVGFESGKSGHSLEERGEDATPAADLTDTCANCHFPHSDSTTNLRLPQETINGKPVTGADNSWCLACHDDGQSWWVSAASGRTKAQYQARIASPSLNATGYPIEGTFPGATAYATPANNAHANIPAGSMTDWAMASREATRVVGDCLWCHSGHRGVSEYDGLLGKFGASTDQVKDTVDGEYAEVCFTCHKVDGLVSAPDIASAALGDAADSGHTIRTAGGRYPKGAPMPCYECHNPHGSTRGNTANISDALGQNLDPRDPADSANVGASAVKVRQFCFSCHVTYDVDPVTSRPWAWNSVSGAYEPVSATAKAIGLDRNVAVNANDLRLPMANGHSLGDTTRSCYECHGDVHKPMSGTSNGGVKCSVCHSALNGMVDDTSTYHHVLDDSTWDQAPGTYDPATGAYGSTPYPTSKDSLSCVSCHVDHSAYEPLPSDDSRANGKAYSLRNSATVANPTPSDTDDTLCLSCHSTEIARNTTGQKANAIQETRVWSVDAALWGESPHDYDSPGPFNDGSMFNANCAKCHGNLQGTLSSGKFSVHFSAEQRLLNALGDTSNASLEVNEEQMCFRCHSEASDFKANNPAGTLLGEPKPSQPTTETRLANPGWNNSSDPLTYWYSWDWYGTQRMKRSNAVIYKQMQPSTNAFGHKPHLYPSVTNPGRHLLSDTDETQAYLSANKHVECADCHNHHVVGEARHIYGTDNRVSEAIRGVRGVGFKPGELSVLAQVNWPMIDPISYGSDVNDELETRSSATYEYEICFKCHSSANAVVAGVPGSGLAAWGGDMKWTTWPTLGTGTKAGVSNWTNVAQDFNAGNNSRHPVLATLSGDYYASPTATTMTRIPGYAPDTVTRGTSTLGEGQVSNGWGPGDTMMCSDCHGDSSAPIAMIPDGTNWKTNPAAELVPQGPHGSSIRFSLRGPGTDWPVKSSTGALITLADLADETYASNIFCSNCHPASVAAYNKAHRPARGTQHLVCTCVSCHVLVPHGGKMSRLIADASTGVGSMPDRLAYQGNKGNVGILSFKKRTDATDYTNTDCAVTGSACAKGQHQTSRGGFTSNQSGGSWENW